MVIIQKNGNVITLNARNLTCDNIYKKCKLKSTEDFEMRAAWRYEDKYVTLFACDDGMANQENKYDLPPPVDCNLFFNNIGIVAFNSRVFSDENLVDFTKKEWVVLYDHLFGGFEDVDESEESEGEMEMDPKFLTKEGYEKNGFVVDDDDIDALGEGENEESEEEYRPSDNSDEDTDNSEYIYHDSEGEGEGEDEGEGEGGNIDTTQNVIIKKKTEGDEDGDGDNKEVGEDDGELTQDNYDSD